ncbi:hypothetical protein Pint_31606 [Pistacia integerrima]|uniref:Uncharacterized protein n=1 Tax=Pistacia integerrima TaxID=434235 RepID=A0ACC0XN77_9ROSI|nr:hypothetical protein Pint_31606 [Pistacia integerrima]
MVYTSGISFPCVPSVYKSTQSSCYFNGDRRSSSLSFFLKKNSLSLTLSRSFLHFIPTLLIKFFTCKANLTLVVGKILAGKPSKDYDASSLTVAASDKVLVPGSKGDGTSLFTDQLETADTISEEQEVLHDVHCLKWKMKRRYGQYKKMREDIDRYEGDLELFSRGYEKLGFMHSFVAWAIVNRYVLLFLESALTKLKPINAVPWVKKVTDSEHKIERPVLAFLLCAIGITYREWALGAKSAALIGDFNNWNPNADIMTRNEFGIWEIFLPNNADGSPSIPHGSHVKIRMEAPSDIKDSIPAWIKFSVQAPAEILYNGIYYDPPAELCSLNTRYDELEDEKYEFQHPQPKRPKSLRIYEAHVGMSSTEPMINMYANFRDDVLPRIKKLGYNAVQLMAIQEHSYYASFGYHMTNFFAPSSRCGTLYELKVFD